MKRDSSAGAVVLLCLFCVGVGFTLAGRQFNKQSDELAERDWTISRLYEVNGSLRNESIDLYSRLKHQELVAMHAKPSLASRAPRTVTMEKPKARHARPDVVFQTVSIPLTEPVAAATPKAPPVVPIDEATKLAVQPSTPESIEDGPQAAEINGKDSDGNVFLMRHEKRQDGRQDAPKAEENDWRDRQKELHRWQRDIDHRKRDLEKELQKGAWSDEEFNQLVKDFQAYKGALSQVPAPQRGP